ncbi:DUF7221 family queuine tRNA-ribosyltransferase-like protein [Streptomyces sp. CA-135486]|uniref:deazapurine DNA modification protein DpdA family protein n=1 Tax=Streptomyces sp. CA-135486 TaxID=3240049 RepID=UPI003D9192A4
MKFYLGTHMPSWLKKRAVTVPLFVSHRRLGTLVKLPRAVTDWALDSGGFTELSMHGTWTVSPTEYVAAVRRYRDEIGRMDWAAPQDWMCEPWIVEKTGLSVLEHQQRTVHNFMELRALASDVCFAPVLQGWSLDDYRRCLDLYADAGVDLTTFETVGIGSVCRRQATSEIGEIVRAMHAEGIRLHGFGVKSVGLRKYAQYLTSADSMAWSFRGRHVPGCTDTHKTEANCLPFALSWRERALALAA